MTFDEYLNLEYADDVNEEPTWCSATIRVRPHHCNPTGNVNGGVLIALADNIATASAGRAYRQKSGKDAFMVGIDLHAVLLANQIGGSIRGVARPVRVGRRITVVRTQIWGDEDRLLAEVTTTHVPN